MEFSYTPTIIYFDIVGYCNAKCTFCPTGQNSHVSKKHIDVDLFKQVLEYLIENNLIPASNKIHLYNYGEATLHPNLDQLISIMADFNIKARLSTNFIRPLELSEKSFKNIAGITFSTSGISDTTYRRIYGTDVNKSLTNLKKAIESFKNIGYHPKPFSVRYLQYKFNKFEVSQAKEYFESLGIEFETMSAYINDQQEFNLYAQDKLSRERKLEIEEMVHTNELNKLIENNKKSLKKCELEKFLNIDENGNLIGCCGLPNSNQEYNLGSILDLTSQEIYQKKVSMNICKECFSLGTFVPYSKK